MLKGLLAKHITILDRYLFEQFLGPFFLAIAGFALIGIVDILFFLVDLVINSGIPTPIFIKLLLYKLPAIMVLFFPMAVLFSVMLLLVRMAKDNELTVLRTSGIGSFRIVLPIILLFILSSLLSYSTNEYIVPWTNESSEQIIKKQIKKTPPPNIVDNVVFKDGENRYFYIKKIDSKKGIMENVLIFEQTRTFPRFISAKTALWNGDTWRLLDGYIQETNSDGIIEFLDHYEEMIINVSQSVNSFYKRQKRPKEMDSKELKQRIMKLDKGGLNTRNLRIAYHMKRSLPIACFIFGIIGIANCFTFVRSGKDWWGVIVSICIAVLSVGFYFFMMALFRAFAKGGHITPFLGAWLPNILYGVIAGGIVVYQCRNK
jgi:lipopolysaccharide export system permease protein